MDNLHKNWHIIDTFFIDSCVNLLITHKIDTWLTHFTRIPGVNGKLTQKLTHQLHIFLSLSCQFTIYTKIDTLLTHFLLNLESICRLHTKLTHDWHILSRIPGVNGKVTQKLTHFLHVFGILYPWLPYFKGVKMCRNVSNMSMCQPPSWHIHWHSWHMCQKCVIFS